VVSGFSDAGHDKGTCLYQLAQEMKTIAMGVIARRSGQKLDDDLWRQFISGHWIASTGWKQEEHWYSSLAEF
jgi:hypothetical protein